MKKVTNSLLWIFAIGQLGWSMLSGIVSNWLVYFYQPTTELLARGQSLFITQGKVFLGMTIIGLITASGRIFDAITDPLIASKSDRNTHKLGRRIPFMRYSAIPFGLVTILLFILPFKRESAINNLLLLIFALLFYLFMTCYCTPYNALIPALGRSQKDRINISTYISVTYFLGTAFAYLVPNIAGIFEGSMGYTNSFRLTIAILALFAIIFMLIPAYLIKEKDYCDTTPTNSPTFESLIKTYKNKEFKKFVLSDILYWIALTIFQTGLPFYITVLMRLEDSWTFMLFALMTGLSLLFYAPVNIMAKKIGKKKLVIFAFILFSLTYGITSFAGKFGLNGVVWGIIVAILASFPMAILGILPQAIVADISDADMIKTKENRQGMFFAARTFAFKMGQSVAMLVFTSLASIGSNDFGYRLTTIIACIFCLFGGIILFSYDEEGTLKTIGENNNE